MVSKPFGNSLWDKLGRVWRIGIGSPYDAISGSVGDVAWSSGEQSSGVNVDTEGSARGMQMGTGREVICVVLWQIMSTFCS